MIFDKIKIYLLFQITKYFFLILFIFLSVAWILQITRLFTISNFLHIQIFDIILLSFYLIPNILTIITPFILIFALLLCFIKLHKDNELIAILSLGFGLNPLKKTLLFFCFFTTIIFTFFSFYFAPKIYEQYKIKEYDLRNTIDFNKMTFSNFLDLNNSTILDFKKNNREYNDIFINFNDEKENIVYAKKGNIFTEDGNYNFKLSDGFKISIDENKQIEKLEFLNYILKIENQINEKDKVVDRNTFTIFDDYKSKNYLNISFKFIDIFLLLFIFYFFYKNNLKNINLNSFNNVFFSLSCISLLLINQILKNSEISIYYYFILILLGICLIFLISNIKNKYE